MKIIKKKVSNQLKVDEDYSDYEEDEVIGVLGRVCQQIDELDIARFDVIFFQKSDSLKKIKTDFLYDFSSIIIEIEDLICAMEDSDINSTELYFYELRLTVFFEKQGSLVDYHISEDGQKENLYSNSIKKSSLQTLLKKLLIDFAEILYTFFPESFRLFVQNDYIVSSSVESL